MSVVHEVEDALATTTGPYFLDSFSIADVVFTPYVERMSASLFYYKGYTLRDPKANPRLSTWFDAMETRDTYKGTMSDMHTHVHDLPPQMGGCYENGEQEQQRCKALVNQGPWTKLPDVSYPSPPEAKEEALFRVLKHKDTLLSVNSVKDTPMVDEALRCALTTMISGELCTPPQGADVPLRYIRDRISVPRDMPLWSARHLRAALEATSLSQPLPSA